MRYSCTQYLTWMPIYPYPAGIMYLKVSACVKAGHSVNLKRVFTCWPQQMYVKCLWAACSDCSFTAITISRECLPRKCACRASMCSQNMLLKSLRWALYAISPESWQQSILVVVVVVLHVYTPLLPRLDVWHDGSLQGAMFPRLPLPLAFLSSIWTGFKIADLPSECHVF